LGLGTLYAFFKLWDGWNDLPDKQMLVVCVSLRYEIAQSQGLRNWLKVWSLGGRRKLEGHNQRLKDHLQTLSEDLYSPNFSLVIIPELESVLYDDAYTWAQYYWSVTEIERLYAGKDRLPFSLIISHYEQHASQRHNTRR
jgi:hypothetical protein